MNAKKYLLLIAVLLGGTTVFAISFLLYAQISKFAAVHVIAATGVVTITFIGIAVGSLKMNALRKGLVVDDELSLYTLEKAMSRAFITSLYLWFMVLIFSTGKEVLAETNIAIGLAGMGLSLMGHWTWLKIRGIPS